MALGMPSAVGGGGPGFVSGPGILKPSNPMSSQQQAALNYLQGASGLNLASYNNTLSNLGASRNAINAAYGNAAGAAGRDYGLTIRGIDEDLKFGNQLREQEQYRNVDLGRSRSIADFGNARSIWDIMRGDIGRRAGFNTRNYGLAQRQTTAQYDTGMRSVGSDAIARGARTAAGTLAQFGDVRTSRDIGFGRNRLDFDTTKQALDTEHRRGAQAYKYAGQTHGLDMKTFASIAKTYGIQAAQALAQAALGKERAAANRSSATGGAGAQRAQALAGLSSGQSNAYNQYMQQQMGLYSQLLGL